jgi:hypothetical protein
VIIQGCGGGGSVRMRNTLHEVGGGQFIVTSAVYGEREIKMKIKYFRNNKIFYKKRRENIIYLK